MNYASTLLAAVLPSNRKIFLQASARITKSHLHSDRSTALLWELLVKYTDMYGDLPHPKVVKDVLEKGLDGGEAALAWQTYAVACQTSVSETEYQHAMQSLIDEQSRQRTGEALATAYEVLERGFEVDGERREGHAAAREYLSNALAQIDRESASEAAPEGDVRNEVSDIMQDYLARKEAGETPGIQAGLKVIDSVGGFQRGDLALIAAFTSAGKSQLCVHIAWHAAIMQGKNVYFATSETARTDIINRMLARHSKLPKFNFPEGLDHGKIRRAKLSPAEEKVFADVLEDLNYGNYGAFHVAQVPRGSTLNYLENKMLLKHQEIGLDLAVMDYLNLLKPTTRRGTQREEASDILKDSKVLATGFAGVGIPFISPWQVSRPGHEQAQATQSYSLSAMSEASEAEKSADLILTVLHDKKISAKRATLQIIKNRNDATSAPIDVDVDYSSSYFGDIAGGAAQATAATQPFPYSGSAY